MKLFYNINYGLIEIFVQNGSAVSITLGDDSLKLIGHPQNNSSNWFLIPFINR